MYADCGSMGRRSSAGSVVQPICLGDAKTRDRPRREEGLAVDEVPPSCPRRRPREHPSARPAASIQHRWRGPTQSHRADRARPSAAIGVPYPGEPRRIPWHCSTLAPKTVKCAGPRGGSSAVIAGAALGRGARPAEALRTVGCDRREASQLVPANGMECRSLPLCSGRGILEEMRDVALAVCAAFGQCSRADVIWQHGSAVDRGTRPCSQEDGRRRPHLALGEGEWRE
eukprot:scaffold304073_cov30-Tisochrysis_lutea.AAC.2